MALRSLARTGATEHEDHADVVRREGRRVLCGGNDLRFRVRGRDGWHGGGRAGRLGGADGVSSGFGGLAGAGSYHQCVGDCAEEGDGDEGPDFEGRASRVGVGAGPVGPVEGGSLEDGGSSAWLRKEGVDVGLLTEGGP